MNLARYAVLGGTLATLLGALAERAVHLCAPHAPRLGVWLAATALATLEIGTARRQHGGTTDAPETGPDPAAGEER
ncbi:hypothetical protein RM780_09940 [Streptomyces sp. DSM 44917]|uniref:Uncharacterized protein n=1 Tax=Streptomyces boetiae TaxID=3075541 RepID=A0ABU2L7U6_9ACTN|nr:hypothetical protein [Streptomyces sp. DSM 44917]MDT0307283.1 hypothetical protein [Streptomyces sp. DSM 44917]